MTCKTHLIRFAKGDESVRGAKIVAVFSRPWVNQLPLHVIFRDQMTEVSLNECDVRLDRCFVTAKAASRCDRSADGAADRKVIPKGVLERHGTGIRLSYRGYRHWLAIAFLRSNASSE